MVIVYKGHRVSKCLLMWYQTNNKNLNQFGYECGSLCSLKSTISEGAETLFIRINWKFTMKKVI